MAIKTTYYALEDAEKLAKDRLMKIDTVRASRRSTDLARRLHRNWLQYYGLNDWKASLSDNLYASGPNGERVELRVNHLRNIIQHIVQLITGTRPDLVAKAANMDIKSLKQTQIANSIIDHYLMFENVWKFIDIAVESACFLHGGFVHAEWDPEKGEPWAGDASGQVAYQGDFTFRNLSLFDVVFDQVSSSWEEIQDMVVRQWYNKYDLVRKHPENEAKIMAQKTKREWEVYDSLPLVFFTSDDSIQIEVHTNYHMQTPTVPFGRMTKFLSDGTVLEDGPLPYDRIPVFRIAASETLGTPHAWCPATDLASLQECLNKAGSTIATNQFAFGTQNIWAPRGSRLDVTQLTGGLNLIEGSAVGPNGGKPEVLQLLNTPKEIFDWYDMIVRDMETLSGINQVTRGNPEAGLTAGVALALISTQSMQFLSPLQRSYAECARDIMEFVIDTLRKNATTPRLLHMVGKGRREALQYFTSGDLDGINRVGYELGNPMARTAAGRMQLAQSVIEAGVQLNMNQLLEIIDKGRIDPLTKGSIDQLDNIILENEQLRDGVMMPVLAGDDHRMHLDEHVKEIQNPDLRQDLMAQQAILAHINQHVQMYMGGDIVRGIIEGAIPPPYMMMMGGGAPGGAVGGHPPGGPPQHGGNQGGHAPVEKKAPPKKEGEQEKTGVPRVVLPQGPQLPTI